MTSSFDQLASSILDGKPATEDDALAVLVRAVRRRQRLESLAAVPELVLARPDGDGGWQLSVVRRGRLVAGVEDGGRAEGAAGEHGGGEQRAPGHRRPRPVGHGCEAWTSTARR